MGDRRRVSDWRMTVHVINIVFSWYHLKFNFWPECPIFTGTAGIVRYCPVFRTVRCKHVSVPVEWPVREILVVLVGTVRYYLPCYKVLYFINNEDQEALNYKTLWHTNAVASYRKNKSLGLCIRVLMAFTISLIYV